MTSGAADEIVGAAITGREPPAPRPTAPLPGAPFDVVIADLLYTQLLYPALTDAGLPATAIDECLRRHGQPLTDQLVRTLHSSAPSGVVVHVHALLGWWPGHPQPITPDAILTLANHDQDGDRRISAYLSLGATFLNGTPTP